MTTEVKNQELAVYLKSLLGKDYNSFISAPVEPTSIRANTLKISTKQIYKLLKEYRYDFEKVPFNQNGFILNSDPIPLSHSLAFFEGFFQYQGVSSQLPALILDVKPGNRVLDMTAAPGSKSGQLAAGLKQRGELVLNDSSYNRLQALQTNMQRSGAVNHYILKQRGENLSRFYPEYFDKILLDAPCTAIGTYFSTPEKYSWWSAKKLDKLSKLQYQLMVSAIKCLRIGGDIVYSTCSVAPEENELLIEKIIQKYPVSIQFISDKFKFNDGWTSYNNMVLSEEMKRSIRVWPHKHSIEGFFVVKLKKIAKLHLDKEPVSAETATSKSADHPKIKQVLMQLSDSWGIDPKIWTSYRYFLTKTRIWMMSLDIEKVPRENFVSAGLLLGEERLNGWKLVNGSAQYLSENISNRRVSLSESEMKTLFQKGKVTYTNLPEDYYALEYRGRVIGSVYHEKGSLRIRLPHLFTRFRI